MHARLRRAIRDGLVQEVQLVRLRCKACGTTWGMGLWVETVDEQDLEALARTLTWVLSAGG